MKTNWFKATLASVLAISCCFNLAQESEEGESTESDDEAIVLPIKIQTTVINTEPGRQTYTQEAIRNAPVGQNNIGDLLKLNPAVDFSRNSDLSVGTASLRPAEISIHGESFYQNLYLIDAADTSNDLNPADSTDVYAIPSLVAPIGGSSPQGYYIDTSLVDVVEVLDSNISAKHGGFVGGVVSTELKEAEEESRFSVDVGLRKSEWEKYHVTEDDINANDKYRGVYTPDYQKLNYGISLSHRFQEDFGVTLGITQRHSNFAQEYEDDTDTIRQISYDDTIQNVLGKVDTKLGESPLDVSFRFSNRSHDGLTATTYDGTFIKEHKGMGITVDLRPSKFNDRLNLKLTFDRLGDVLDSEDNYFVYHEYRENSGVPRFEGSYGDINQGQTRIAFLPELDFEDIVVGSNMHEISVGASFRRTDSYYERPDTVTYEQYYCVRDNGREGCIDQDGDGRSSEGDQFLNRRFFYQEGIVDLEYTELGAFIEDNIVMGQFDLRLGLRGDRDSFLGNFNASPRTLLTWRLPNFDDAKLTLGANRYYGRSFLRFELNDAIYGWRESYANLTRPRGRDGEEVPCSIPDFEDCTHLLYDNRTGAADLKTPYANEFSLGWSQALSGWRSRYQLVSRSSRDSVRRDRIEGLYYYNNDGESETLSLSVSMDQEEPLSLLGSETKFSLGLSYRDSTSNYQDDGGYDDAVDEELIYYKGSLIDTSELPPWDYNIPFGIRAQSVTSIPGLNVNWMNFLNFKAGGTVALDSREDYDDPASGNSFDIYEDFEFDNLATIDSRISWSADLGDNLELWVNLEIRNLLDKVADYSHLQTRRRFTSGRRIGMDMGIRF